MYFKPWKRTTLTSDAGDVLVDERVLWCFGAFRRTNTRPVSPTCKDIRREWGVRVGVVVFAVRTTKRVYGKVHPPEYMATAL